MTCHYFDESFSIRHRKLAVQHLPGSHCYDNVADALDNIFLSFGIAAKLVAIVTDNAANVRSVGRVLNARLGFAIVHFGCACHVINLIVKKLLGKTMEEVIDLEIEEGEYFEYHSGNQVAIGNFKALVKKCRDITPSYHKSTQLHELLTEQQALLNLPKNCLVQEVSTRWNSLFLMLYRILEQATVSTSMIL